MVARAVLVCYNMPSCENARELEAMLGLDEAAQGVSNGFWRVEGMYRVS